jgi:hypothetical protein
LRQSETLSEVSEAQPDAATALLDSSVSLPQSATLSSSVGEAQPAATAFLIASSVSLMHAVMSRDVSEAQPAATALIASSVSLMQAVMSRDVSFGAAGREEGLDRLVREVAAGLDDVKQDELWRSRMPRIRP